MSVWLWREEPVPVNFIVKWAISVKSVEIGGGGESPSRHFRGMWKEGESFCLVCCLLSNNSAGALEQWSHNSGHAWHAWHLYALWHGCHCSYVSLAHFFCRPLCCLMPHIRYYINTQWSLSTGYVHVNIHWDLGRECFSKTETDHTFFPPRIKTTRLLFYLQSTITVLLLFLCVVDVG